MCVRTIEQSDSPNHILIEPQNHLKNTFFELIKAHYYYLQ